MKTENTSNTLDMSEEEMLEDMKQLFFDTEQPSWNWAIVDITQNFMSCDVIRDVITGNAPTWQEAYIEALREIQIIEKHPGRDPFAYAVINLSPGSVPFMWHNAQERKTQSQEVLQKLGFGEDMEAMSKLEFKNTEEFTKEDAEDALERAQSAYDYTKARIEEKNSD